MCSPSSFADLDQRERRRLITRSALRTGATVAALLVLYSVIPVAGRSGARAIIELILGLAVFALMLILQVRGILRADHPELRAVQALALALPVLTVVFAFTYISLWHSDHASFSEPLNRVGGIYFTMSVIGTVGFGDITAKTDLARIIVTVQILLDIVLVVGIVRAIVLAARVRRSRQQSHTG